MTRILAPILGVTLIVFAKPCILGGHRCQYIDRFKPALGVLKQGSLRHDGVAYEQLVRLVTENNRAALRKFTQQ